MKRARTPFLIGTMVLSIAVLCLWVARFRLATAFVDRRLAAAHVPASYRITRIGPFLERMEDVRIGDPARPDVTARRIDVAVGYGVGGPVVTGVTVDGVALRATLDQNGLHLGALDRLLPKTSGGAATLPDIQLSIAGSRLALATPNGDLGIMLEGDGNPARSFRGKARVEAEALRLASCRLQNTTATMTVESAAGQPRFAGPVTIGAIGCPAIRLGRGTANVDVASNAAFDRIAVQARLAGFGGSTGPVRFAALSGPVEASGRLGQLGVHARLGFDHAAAPTLVRAIAQSATLPAGTPLTPIVAQGRQALSHLFADARADVSVDAEIRGEQVAVRVHQASLRAADGGWIHVIERGGLNWAVSGWRADGDLRSGGGMVPAMALQVRQAAPGKPFSVAGELAEYRAGAARIALPAIHATWDGTAARFAAQLRADGPLGDGFVTGLDVPVRGRIDTAGGITIGSGCQPVALESLRLIGFRFGAARTSLCGAPLLAILPGGGVRVAATTGPIHLAGQTRSGEPVTLDLARTRVTERGLAAETLGATLGESHLDVASVSGAFGRAVGGGFSGAAGAIAHVPLLLSGGEGRWALAGGALTLAGTLRIADAAPSPRFLPLTTDDLRFALRNGRIDATATLHEPKTGAAITAVTLTHTLSDGVGHAVLDVPGITFAPKRLQPEMLTPLTLGVIANVGGTVAGEGRIDWSAGGVTSKGAFATDRLDLAAAFGPVAGISGRIVFTDLLGLVSAPHQAIAIAETNPGVAVTNGLAHLQLVPGNRVAIEDAVWPFAGGTLRLEPTTLDFGAEAERHLTFRVEALDAAAFVQQLDFPNLAATGTFDGVLPMIFDSRGGRIEGGSLIARQGGGTLAYVGELTTADIGTMGKLAFDALKAIRYSSLDIRFDGRLDGEMVSQVAFTGVREATPEQSLVTRLLRNLPFRFNIRIRAPFRGLIGTARTYMDPRLLLNQAMTTPAEPDVQPAASGTVR